MNERREIRSEKLKVKSGPFFTYHLSLFTCIMGVVCMVVILTGCGAKTVPVSNNTSTTSKADSTSITNTSKKDSSSHVETVTEKTLPGATVEILATQSQLDSLIHALAQLPTSVTRTVYYVDPQLKAKLSIAIDSLGRRVIKCQALDQRYYEKSVQQTRYIENLTAELTKIKEENTSLKEQVKVKKPTWGDKFKEGITAGLIWFVVLGGAFMLIREGVRKFFKEGNN